MIEKNTDKQKRVRGGRDREKMGKMCGLYKV